MVAWSLPVSYDLGGYKLLVPRAAVKAIDMPMEQAMRFVMTAGIKSEAG